MTAAQQLTQLVPSLLKKVKGYFISEAAGALQVRYADHLRFTQPERAESGRRFYKEANTTNQLRALYGNIERAIAPKGEGNVTEVFAIADGMVFASGIDTDTEVETYNGNTVSLLYAQINDVKRPFLSIGYKEFVEQDYPEAMERILSELEDEFGS